MGYRYRWLLILHRSSHLHHQTPSAGSRPPTQRETGLVWWHGHRVPGSRVGINQVGGDHHRSPERALCSPGTTPPSQPPSATSERCHAPHAASTSDQAWPKLTRRGPGVGGRGLRNNAGASLAERWQIKGRVSWPLLQSDIEVSLDEESPGQLLFVCLLFKWIRTDI